MSWMPAESYISTCANILSIMSKLSGTRSKNPDLINNERKNRFKHSMLTVFDVIIIIQRIAEWLDLK